jgi:hypothetical protein
MLVYKLILVGEVRGRDTPMSSCLCWPTGISYDEAKKKTDDFAVAFDLRRVTYDYRQD